MRSLRLVAFSALLLATLFILSACSFSDYLNYFNKTDDTTTIVTDTATTETPPETSTTPSLFASDFTDVCNGIPQAKAAAYASTAGIHPALLFGRDSTTESYYEKSFTLPDAWQKPWEEAIQTELVVCVTTLPKALASTCPFDDGYSLDNYAADYAVALYSAQDGKQLATTTLSLPADDCPSVHYFTALTENSYPDYKQSLIDFLKPYIQK